MTGLVVHIRVALARHFSELTVFDARLYSDYALWMSLLSAATLLAVPGLSRT